MTRKTLFLAAIASMSVLGGVAVAAEATRAASGPMRADANGDGVVSRGEYFAASEARFKARDANGDRKLAGEEIKGPRGRFARQDADNDGALSFAEAAGRTSARFQRLDANSDGKLTLEELGPGRGHGRRGTWGGGAGMMRGPGGPQGGLGAMMLSRVDTDRDGKISRDEMRAEADRRFDRLDADKDGFVAQSELSRPRGRGPGGPGSDMPPPPAPEDDGV